MKASIRSEERGGILPGNEPGSRRSWRGTLLLLAVIVAAHLLSSLLLAAVVRGAPARGLSDVTSSFVLAAIVAAWVAIEARRAGEEAHPWIVFAVVGGGMSLLLLAATWLTSWI